MVMVTQKGTRERERERERRERERERERDGKEKREEVHKLPVQENIELISLREFLWIKSFWGYTKRTKEKKRERTPSVRYQAYTDYYVRRQLWHIIRKMHRQKYLKVSFYFILGKRAFWAGSKRIWEFELLASLFFSPYDELQFLITRCNVPCTNENDNSYDMRITR